MKLQAPRQNGHRQFLWIRGREQELHVRRRFLECLEQGIKRMRRKHVNLVDEVHLVSATRRRILHVLEQLARVVDLGARSRVHFEQIDEPAGVDVLAGRAMAAGLRGHTFFTVQRLCEDPGYGRLADTTCAGKQKRMVNPARVEGIGQRLPDVVLSDQFLEAAWPPFAGEYEVAHRAR